MNRPAQPPQHETKPPASLPNEPHNRQHTGSAPPSQPQNTSWPGQPAKDAPRTKAPSSVNPEVVGREHPRVRKAGHLVVLIPREEQPRQDGQAQGLRQQASHCNHLGVGVWRNVVCGWWGWEGRGYRTGVRQIEPSGGGVFKTYSTVRDRSTPQ